MKISVRQGVFETNSSSVHSLTMVEDVAWQKWIKGETIFNIDSDKFIPTTDEDVKYYFNLLDKVKGNVECSVEESDEADIELEDMPYMTYEDFKAGDIPFYESVEPFHQTYTTKNGEIIHAFGYSGNDY